MSAPSYTAPTEAHPSVQTFEVIGDAVFVTVGEAQVALDASALVRRLHETGEQPGVSHAALLTCNTIANRLEWQAEPDALHDAASLLQALGSALVPAQQTAYSYNDLTRVQRGQRRRALERTLTQCVQRGDAEAAELVAAHLAELDEDR